MKETLNGIIDKRVPLPWLLGLVFAIIVWGLSLQLKVEAMSEKGVALREDFEGKNSALVAELKDIDRTVNQIHNNQLIIMHDLGLTPVK